MLNKLNSILYFLFFVLYVNSVSAELAPVKQLKSILSNTKTLTADFRQVSLNPKGQPTHTSYGVFYLSRPGKFRWDYKKPFVQEIVSDSSKIWFYDADLEQVTIKKIDDSLGSTPALLLSGDIALEANFNIEKQGIDEGLQWIKLSPKKKESEFNYILIGLNDGVLGGMELSDNFGQLTRIYFSNIKKNKKLDNSIFTFVAPKGVDIFEK
ncbi:MAG: outer membrane lipoprotein chaperone LolA [Methylococcaceae bacterium]|nr:outer membrane lipoprotein chaperone LolA [Methylococcaceae bacterium]